MKGKNEAFQNALIARDTLKFKKQMERQGATGAWLTTTPDGFGGTELSKTKWHHNMSIPYGWYPQALPHHCNGYGEGFTVQHGINCKKGGLVTIHHGNMQDKWTHLCALSLSSTCVTVKSTIFYVLDNEGSNQPKDTTTLVTKPGVMSSPMASGNMPVGPSLTSICVT
ncbi:hypothetical protein ACHAW6_010698 [Cyclotella cf. meneghiniana]